MLDELVAAGADAAIRVDQAHDELAAAIAANGPYDLIADYLLGAPAEVALAALIRMADREGVEQPEHVRYIHGMTAGEVAALPGRRGVPGELDLIAAGDVSVDVAVLPLAKVEQAWPRARSDRRTVLVP